MVSRSYPHRNHHPILLHMVPVLRQLVRQSKEDSLRSRYPGLSLFYIVFCFLLGNEVRTILCSSALSAEDQTRSGVDDSLVSRGRRSTRCTQTSLVPLLSPKNFESTYLGSYNRQFLTVCPSPFPVSIRAPPFGIRSSCGLFPSIMSDSIVECEHVSQSALFISFFGMFPRSPNAGPNGREV
jgi:hypothetical protein